MLAENSKQKSSRASYSGVNEVESAPASSNDSEQAKEIASLKAQLAAFTMPAASEPTIGCMMCGGIGHDASFCPSNQDYCMPTTSTEEVCGIQGFQNGGYNKGTYPRPPMNTSTFNRPPNPNYGAPRPPLPHYGNTRPLTPPQARPPYAPHTSSPPSLTDTQFATMMSKFDEINTRVGAIDTRMNSFDTRLGQFAGEMNTLKQTVEKGKFPSQPSQAHVVGLHSITVIDGVASMLEETSGFAYESSSYVSECCDGIDNDTVLADLEALLYPDDGGEDVCAVEAIDILSERRVLLDDGETSNDETSIDSNLTPLVQVAMLSMPIVEPSPPIILPEPHGTLHKSSSPYRPPTPSHDRSRVPIKEIPRMTQAKSLPKSGIQLQNLDVMPYADPFVDLCKDSYSSKEDLNVNEHAGSSKAMLGPSSMSPKEVDPGGFCVTMMFGDGKEALGMLDLGAGVNMMPYSIYEALGLSGLKKKRLRLQLADHSICLSKGVVENVFVIIGGLQIPVDFVVLDVKTANFKDQGHSILLGRPFLRASNAQIDMKHNTLALSYLGNSANFSFRELPTGRPNSTITVGSLLSSPCPFDEGGGSFFQGFVVDDVCSTPKMEGVGVGAPKISSTAPCIPTRAFLPNPDHEEELSKSSLVYVPPNRRPSIPPNMKKRYPYGKRRMPDPS